MSVLAHPQFFFLFANGLGKPLFKPSSGQALIGMGNQPSVARSSLPVIGTGLPDPEMVLANEVFTKGLPRPFQASCIRTDTGRPACVFMESFSLDGCVKMS